MPETLSRSPDGRYVVEAEPVPMRMSHVVFPPVVRDLEGGVVASLEGTLWSADRATWSDGRVTLVLRKYPGRAGTFTATVDLEGGSATVRGRTVPAAGLGRALDLAAAGHGGLAALLYDTLDALSGVPDASDLRLEIYSILHDLEAGETRTRDALALYQSERALQDVVFEHGWAGRVLEVAGPPDRSRPDLRPEPDRPDLRASGGLPRLARVSVAVVVLLVAAAVLGGPWAALGAGAFVAAFLLPVLVALVRFVLRPVGSLLRGPRTLRARVKSAPASAALFVALEVALIVGGIAALARGCG